MATSRGGAARRGSLAALQCLLAVLLLLVTTKFARADVPKIADVTSIEALRKLEPLHANKDWDIRVGLSDGGEDAGPWKILYCLANYLGEGDPPALKGNGHQPGEPIGPVWFAVDDGKSHCVYGMATWGGGRSKLPRERLYAATILVAWPGRYVIEIRNHDAKPLAQRTIDIETPRPCYWQDFAELIDFGKGDGGVSRETLAAYPEFGGMMPVLDFRADGTGVLPPDQHDDALALHQESVPDAAADKHIDRMPASIPLDRRWQMLATNGKRHPVDANERPYPLQLELRNGLYIISSDAQITDWPDMNLLARWWVNGKAVVPERSDNTRLIDMGRGVVSTREFKIPFGLPTNLGRVKAGDKVALQVLYCPQGFGWVTKSREGSMSTNNGGFDSPFPLESNRIEFVITDPLLAAAATQPGPKNRGDD